MATENSEVSALNPLMLVVSEHSHYSDMPGYESGLYCKWRIRSANQRPLSLQFVDVRIYPMSTDCAHDGLVVFTAGGDRLGKLVHCMSAILYQ